jgi:hypothetical protein
VRSRTCTICTRATSMNEDRHYCCGQCPIHGNRGWGWYGTTEDRLDNRWARTQLLSARTQAENRQKHLVDQE